MAYVQSFTIAEFMAGKHRETAFDRIVQKSQTIRDRIKTARLNVEMKSALGYTLPLAFVSSMGARSAFATSAARREEIVPALSETTQQTILHAFDPLIDLIQALSYPIAGVMIAGGCLFIMIGSRDKGMDMLRNASMGYILVQLSPLLLKLLVGIGAQV
jgi:hypothetical protein